MGATFNRTSKLMIRLPADLHRRLRERAAANERSLNGEIVYALKQYVGLGAPEAAAGATKTASADEVLLCEGITRAERGETQPLPDEALVVLRREIAGGASPEEALARAGLTLDGTEG